MGISHQNELGASEWGSAKIEAKGWGVAWRDGLRSPWPLVLGEGASRRPSFLALAFVPHRLTLPGRTPPSTATLPLKRLPPRLRRSPPFAEDELTNGGVEPPRPCFLRRGL